MAPLLSIIVLTWNSAEEIEACLNSLESNAGNVSHEVLVVDNASTDDTVALVTSRFSAVKLMLNEENLGFAGGINRGIEEAHGRYLLVLNPDTVVHRDALPTMVGYLESHPRVAAVGPRLIEGDGRIQRSCIHYPTICRVLLAHLTEGGYLPAGEGPAAVEALSGAALMVRRDVVRAVGALDTDFFMYGEDTEWCYRMTQAGWEVHYLPSASVTHLRGRSAEKVPVQTYVRRRVAKLLFLDKHGSRWQVWLLAQLFAFNIHLRRWRTRDPDGAAYYEAVLARFHEEVRKL